MIAAGAGNPGACFPARIWVRLVIRMIHVPMEMLENGAISKGKLRQIFGRSIVA